jgi:hypothetical protein
VPLPFVALLGAVATLLGTGGAAPQALAAPSKVTLEVNENCVQEKWPCWTTEGAAAYRPPYMKSVTIASGGTAKFIDHGRATNIAWTTAPTSCDKSVPEPPAANTNWEATCTFATPGIYKFQSASLFYPEYEIIVAGPPTPTATTGQATGVTETKATLNGSVNPEGQATSYYFEYGSTESYGAMTGELSAGSGSTSQEFHFTWTGLSPNTTYYFQLVAVYGAGKTKAEGGKMTFKTAAPPGAPTASTQPATGATETEATLNGTFNPDGKLTKSFFEWGTSTVYGQTTEESSASEDHVNHPALAKLIKLAPGTVYHFRVVAKNTSSEIAYGADHEFKTLPSPTTTTTTTPPPTTTTTPTIPPPIEPLPSPPFVGGPSLRSSQHGFSVRGSVDVGQSGAGGRLEVDLIAKSASLASAQRSGSKSLQVGRLVRTSLSAGNVSFSVALTARGKSALRRHHKLALTVKITLTPTHGKAVTITRSVTLRA